jgi:hypothetical protein
MSYQGTSSCIQALKNYVELMQLNTVQVKLKKKITALISYK